MTRTIHFVICHVFGCDCCCGVVGGVGVIKSWVRGICSNKHHRLKHHRFQWPQIVLSYHYILCYYQLWKSYLKKLWVDLWKRKMSLVLTKNLIAKESGMKFAVIYSKIEQYVGMNPKFTITGALRAANMTMSQLTRISECCDNEEEKRVLRLFEELKLIIAEFLEKEIIYQEKKFYNHNQASWMLKKIYPEMYGENIVIKENKSVSAKETQYSFAKDLKNESGFSLREKNIS